MKGIIDIHSLSREQIEYVLDKAKGVKQGLLQRDPRAYRFAEGKQLLAALLFYEDSTRTRNSFDVAAKRLGLEVVGFASVQGTSVKKGESLRHTLDMFHSYGVDTVILRHPLDGAAKFASDHLDIPVFNAGDGKHEHPTQTILDLFTIREHSGKLDDIDIGMGGDLKYGRTVHSLAIALAKFKNVRLHFFSHDSLAMPRDIITFLEDQGVSVTVYETLEDLLPNVDIFYQTRIQKERMPDEQEYNKAKDACRFVLKHMDLTRESFGLMHPLPINKEYPSVAPEVDQHPKAIYKQQAGNGVPTRLVELAISLGLVSAPKGGIPSEKHKPFFVEREITAKSKREDQTLKPIQGSGTVIDHLEAGTAQKLMFLLRVEERGDVYRGGTVRRRSNRESLKAMLMIEGRELTENELRVVAALSPGCTVNDIREGSVVRKIRLNIPDVISGIKYLRCPNTNCITRPEHFEHVPSTFMRASEKLVRCYYCDTLISGKNLF